jgi:hypothetical protein
MEGKRERFLGEGKNQAPLPMEYQLQINAENIAEFKNCFRIKIFVTYTL